MTTSEAAEGRAVWYIKFCPEDRQDCRDWRWDKDKRGYTKEEASPRFKEHLYKKHHIVGPSADKICADSK